MNKHCTLAPRRAAISQPTKKLPMACALALAAWSLPASAVDLAVFGGNGNAVDVFGINIRTDPWKTWNFSGGASAVVLGEGEIASWHGKEAQAPNTFTNRDIVAIGFKPVIRYFPTDSSSFRPYLEAGLGVHLISKTTINQSRNLPTTFQFGETLGVGGQFCAQMTCSLGLRLQHVSNAGIKQPNNGITFTEVTFGYRF